MIARDSPYFAVSKADGSFEIKNDLAECRWNFACGRRRRNSKDVTVDGKAYKWSKGRMKITSAGDEKDMKVVVDAECLSSGRRSKPEVRRCG